MDADRRWLCLDCGGNTFESNENYYFLKDRLWRKLVPREQRHGMICRACIERRLVAPSPRRILKERRTMSRIQKISRWEEADYGIYESLTPQMRQVIDSAIIEFVALRPRKVTVIVRYMYEEAPAHIPALQDWFYMDRIADPNRRRRIGCGH